MKVKFLLACAIMFGISFNTVSAQENQSAKTQRSRIKQGVKSGELTKGEAKNLRKDEKNIRKEVKAARADGKVTHAERKEIRHEKREASRKIFRKKHNNRERH